MGSIALFLRAGALLALSRLMLLRSSTTQTLRRLSARTRSAAPDPVAALRAVRRAGRVVGGACLPQAVALAAMLQRGGQEPTLVLGCLRTLDGSWSAHAWVELGDLVLEPVTSNRHATLAYLNAANGWTPSPPSAATGF
jgi:hypothetical protein